MVRLQALVAPAPRLSSPSVHNSKAQHIHFTRCDHQFNPHPCFRERYWCSGFYRVVRASWSTVTPSP